MKGRHPLLNDVDITINPSKGLSVINSESSGGNIAVRNRAHGINDTSQLFLSHRNSNDDAFLEMASSNALDGSLVDQSTDAIDAAAHDEINGKSRSESEVGRLQKGDVRIKDGNADISQDTSLIGDNGNAVKSQDILNGDSPVDTEGSQALQTASVVMNMVDVTMPGVLDAEQKNKVCLHNAILNLSPVKYYRVSALQFSLSRSYFQNQYRCINLCLIMKRRANADRCYHNLSTCSENKQFCYIQSRVNQ